MIIVASVVGYLVIITRSTALDNRLIALQAQRAQLQEDLVALDDRRAALQARDRLYGLANRLHLHEPAAFLIVDVPQDSTPNTGNADLVNHVAAWLHLR